MKILALEHQQIPAMRIMAVIKSLGHEVDLVTDGASAIAKMECGGGHLPQNHQSPWQIHLGGKPRGRGLHL